jgi:hypothetical protein
MIDLLLGSSVTTVLTGLVLFHWLVWLIERKNDRRDDARALEFWEERTKHRK